MGSHYCPPFALSFTQFEIVTNGDTYSVRSITFAIRPELWLPAIQNVIQPFGK
jgi:hypothetical protein